MNQLAVAAFACDRTRIASMQYSRGFSRHTHTWLGMKDWHHTISHDKGATRPLTPMQRWYMERFNELHRPLKAVDEGGKPMLDNMLVVYVGELYTPWNHVANPSVAFTFGKLGGAMRTGRYLDFGSGEGPQPVPGHDGSSYGRFRGQQGGRHGRRGAVASCIGVTPGVSPGIRASRRGACEIISDARGRDVALLDRPADAAAGAGH